MTVGELRERLPNKDVDTKEKFASSIGGGCYDDDRIVEMFRDGGWEAKICDYFGVPTEAVKSANWQHLFNIVISIMIFLALVVAVAAFFKH
jgi:hypothetical protein